MDDAEIKAIADAVEVRLLKKIYNMFYSWSIFIGEEDAVTPTFEEAVRD